MSFFFFFTIIYDKNTVLTITKCILDSLVLVDKHNLNHTNYLMA